MQVACASTTVAGPVRFSPDRQQTSAKLPENTKNKCWGNGKAKPATQQVALDSMSRGRLGPAIY
jgi:hypothetical protein